MNSCPDTDVTAVSRQSITNLGYCKTRKSLNYKKKKKIFFSHRSVHSSSSTNDKMLIISNETKYECGYKNMLITLKEIEYESEFIGLTKKSIKIK